MTLTKKTTYELDLLTLGARGIDVQVSNDTLRFTVATDMDQSLEVPFTDMSMCLGHYMHWPEHEIEDLIAQHILPEIRKRQAYKHIRDALVIQEHDAIEE